MSTTEFKTPLDVRLACRENRLDKFASRALAGYLCVNVVFLHKKYADDFATFCHANPKPCPLLKQFDPGQTNNAEYAKDLDIRTDLGSYDVIQHGQVTEQRQDIVDLFDEQTVTFLIGSSVSFDGLLIEKGYQPAFGPTIQMTNIDCNPVGVFKGKMAVTIRAFDPSITDDVWAYTSHFPKCHGAPVGKNNPQELGIPELNVNWMGQSFDIPENTDRLYWACGITPSMVAQQAKLPFMISYTAGHAMITDIPTENLFE